MAAHGGSEPGAQNELDIARHSFPVFGLPRHGAGVFSNRNRERNDVYAPPYFSNPSRYWNGLMLRFAQMPSFDYLKSSHMRSTECSRVIVLEQRVGVNTSCEGTGYSISKTRSRRGSRRNSQPSNSYSLKVHQVGVHSATNPARFHVKHGIRMYYVEQS